MRVLVRNANNYDMDAASAEHGTVIDGISMTQQHFAEEVDINTLVRRFGLTGELPQDVRMPLNQDFVGILSFQDAMNAIRAAEESFDAMPAHVRDRFRNNPAEFVDFCSKEENRAEVEKLGLVRPEVLAARAAEAAKVAAAAPPAAAGKP